MPPKSNQILIRLKGAALYSGKYSAGVSAFALPQLPSSQATLLSVGLPDHACARARLPRAPWVCHGRNRKVPVALGVAFEPSLAIPGGILLVFGQAGDR